MEAGMFDLLVPSRYLSFTVPNLLLPNFTEILDTDHLRIAVLDTPTQPPTTASPSVAAMLVPKRRENDWIFTTEAGHLQLLLSVPGISRLVLVGNDPSGTDVGFGKIYRRSVACDSDLIEKLEQTLRGLLIGFLIRRENVELGVSGMPFLRYGDSVISCVIIERCAGSVVGEILVEDIEIEGVKREFRRRLRFKRTPNLVQTEIIIVPRKYDGWLDCLQLGELEFEPDLSVLVHPYLAPMVASLSLLGNYLHDKFRNRIRPRALCIGVGGGALVSFLGTTLDFEVVGVEVDEVVLSVARCYFGLQTGEFVQVFLGDGFDILRKLACCGSESKAGSLITNDESDSPNQFDPFCSKFDVIMVDLDSSDCRLGISAPPLEFMQEDVLLAAKASLSQPGIIVINVMPLIKSFHDTLVRELRQVFPELYEIDAGNGENYVIIGGNSSFATTSGVFENPFMEKLKLAISGGFLDSVRKI